MRVRHRNNQADLDMNIFSENPMLGRWGRLGFLGQADGGLGVGSHQCELRALLQMVGNGLADLRAVFSIGRLKMKRHHRGQCHSVQC